MKETKAVAIILCILFAGLTVSLSIESYNKGKCKIVALQAGKSADEISKICK